MNNEAFRAVGGNQGNPDAPFVVEEWSMFYGIYQALQGGFETADEAQWFIDTGRAHRLSRAVEAGLA